MGQVGVVRQVGEVEETATHYMPMHHLCTSTTLITGFCLVVKVVLS